MIPLMAATLFVVVASQLPKLGDSFADVAAFIPFYAASLIVMAFAGKVVARRFRFDAHASRAVVFTGATRNSLVVLPLPLALPGNVSLPERTPEEERLDPQDQQMRAEWSTY